MHEDVVPFESGSSQGFFFRSSQGVFTCHSASGLFIRHKSIFNFITSNRNLYITIKLFCDNVHLLKRGIQNL